MTNYEQRFQTRLTAEINKMREAIQKPDEGFKPFLLCWGPESGFILNKIDPSYFNDDEGKLQHLLTKIFPIKLIEQKAALAAFVYPTWINEMEDNENINRPVLVTFLASPNHQNVQAWLSQVVRREDGSMTIGKQEPYNIEGGDLLLYLRVGFAPILTQ